MYKLNDSEMFSDITDNIAVVINAQTGVYYGMNAAGTLVYKYITEGADIKDIKNHLKNIPQAPADMDLKVDSFIKELLDKNIIVPGDTVALNFSIDASILAKDNFELKVGEYLDAQELLLADPIHDVEKEKGWNPIFKENGESEK